MGIRMDIFWSISKRDNTGDFLFHGENRARKFDRTQTYTQQNAKF